jgi:hypothetical protein
MKFLWTVCLVGLMAGMATAQAPTNLVRNSGMEEVTPQGFAASWNGGEFGKPGRNVALDAQVAHSGKNSLRLGTTAGSFATSAAATIAVKPKTAYYISWWCKTQRLEEARAYLFLQTNKAQRVLPEADQFGTTEWTQHFARYVTGDEETSLHPVLTTHRIGGGGEGFAWFDDIGVYESIFPAEIKPFYERFKRNLEGLSETAVVLSRTPSLTLWADNLEARIYREGGAPDYARPASGLKISSACGEQNYIQIALLPTSDLSQVSLVSGDLKGPGTIAAAQVQWWPVGYTNIIRTRDPQARTGETPDPVLKTAPVDAKAGQNSPFLISVKIPRDTKPGVYRGMIGVRAGDKQITSIPLSVEVYNFTLPQDPAFRTLITYSATSFRPWDKRPLQEIEHDIARVLQAHGVRGSGATAEVPAKIADDKVVCDFTAFDERIQWYIDELHFNAFFLGPMFGGGTGEGWEKHRKWLDMDPLSDDFNRYFPEYMRQVGAHLRQKGWMDMAYLYLWDEPEADYFDNVVALQKLALQGDPEFKIWLTTSPNHEKFWGIVKAWSVPFSRPYFSESSVDRRRAAGDEIWVYNIPTTLEKPAQNIRLWFWQAAKYGAVGAQLWETTFYRGIDPWEDITPEPYPVGRKQESFYVYSAGEAVLLYPGKQGGPPLPSMRLKLIQKGIDDFGYLQVLQQRLTANAKRRKMAEPEQYARTEMQKVASVLVKDIDRYTMDTQVLTDTRRAIAHRIEALPPMP